MPMKEVGKWSISYLQILDEKGKVDEKLEPKISEKNLLALYRWMVLGREADRDHGSFDRDPWHGESAIPPAPGVRGAESPRPEQAGGDDLEGR